MIPFYLNAGVDPKTTNNQGECLLHDIAFKVQRMVFDDDIKVAQLILAKIPDMINHLDIKGRTPLDIAYEWNPNEDTNSMKERKQSLIQLFINHGAKTAKELKKNEP